MSGIGITNVTTGRGTKDSHHKCSTPKVTICMYLSIYPSIVLFIYLPIYPSINLSIHPCIHVSIIPSIHPSIYLSINPSVHKSIHLYAICSLSIHRSVYSFFQLPFSFICIHMHTYIYIYIHNIVHIQICIYVYNYVCTPVIICTIYLHMISVGQSSPCPPFGVQDGSMGG